MSDVLMTYVPTLIRYVAVAVGLGIVMYAAYRVQLAIGIKRESATGRTLVLPWLIGFLIFNVFTIGSSLYLSFTEYNLFSAPEWIGLDNYANLLDVSVGVVQSPEQRSSDVLAPRHDEIMRIEFGDWGYVFGARNEDFWRSIRLTLLYSFLSVPIGLAASLGVAMLLNQHVRGLGFWRVLYYAPAIVPAVSTVLLWRWIFSQSGLINSLFSPVYSVLGIETPSWFNDPSYALPAFIIISLWGIFGANSVILLAGLKGIPKDLYEAAIVDGAGEWAKFRHVTIPMLSPALFYNLVVSTIGALQTFEVAAFIRTPDSVGTFFNWLIFREAFDFRRMGMASAMAWLMLVLVVILTALIFRSSQAWVFYQGAQEEAA
jgi:multiple sugar transport system permease protein